MNLESTMKDFIKGYITEDYLSIDEEAEIMELIESKRGKKKVNERCFASVVEEELKKAKDNMSEGRQLLYQGVFNRCFKRTEFGNMDVSKLNNAKITKFLKEAIEELNLNNIETLLLLRMLRTGLNRLHEEGIMKSLPDEDMYRKLFSSLDVAYRMDNPYTVEEAEIIIDYAENHQADVRALAVGLLMMGGLSLKEIVNLTEADCWKKEKGTHGVTRSLEDLFENERRNRIVTRALNIHPFVLGYVFVDTSSDKRGWDKLSERGLKMKLSSICKETGVPYKIVFANEIIKTR